MKKIGFLFGVGLLALMTVAPLAAQTPEAADAEKQQIQRLKQKLDEMTNMQRELERAVARGGTASNGTRGQAPQSTLSTPFWRNPDSAKTLGLTADQQKKMEEVFQQTRLKLIDLNGSLAKEESVLTALMADLRPDEESRVLGQIDKVAQARTELEKTNARMLLGLRQVLTTEQWNKLSPAPRK